MQAQQLWLQGRAALWQEGSSLNPCPLYWQAGNHWATREVQAYFILFCFGHIVQNMGSYLPNQGSNLCPLLWKLRVLTTEPPGKSQEFGFSCQLFATPAEQRSRLDYSPWGRGELDMTEHSTALMFLQRQH